MKEAKSHNLHVMNGNIRNLRKRRHPELLKLLLKKELSANNGKIFQEPKKRQRIFGTKTYPELFKLILE